MVILLIYVLSIGYLDSPISNPKIRIAEILWLELTSMTQQTGSYFYQLMVFTQFVKRSTFSLSESLLAHCTLVTFFFFTVYNYVTFSYLASCCAVWVRTKFFRWIHCLILCDMVLLLMRILHESIMFFILSPRLNVELPTLGIPRNIQADSARNKRNERVISKEGRYC